jgi:phosphoribosyl 1,2-cyclic phosphodiesterase
MILRKSWKERKISCGNIYVINLVMRRSVFTKGKKNMKKSMTVRFWGVRGSIPSPGHATARYGGNTSCVSINLGEDKILVLDAGTGIRDLGKTLAANSIDIFVVVTHVHWDHIQGFPFFIPIFQKDRVIYVFPYLKGETMLNSLFEQMDGAHFPVTMNHLPSKYQIITRDAVSFLNEHGFCVSQIATNHPGGAYGYRIENDGRSVVYLTDNELDPPYEKVGDIADYAEFSKNADVLIHDAQYNEKDMPLKHGWGHSLVSQACQLAAMSEVKHLLLYHHDPERTDTQLDQMQEDARRWFKENNCNIRCTAAYEGLVLEI